MNTNLLRIATRKSPLAMCQTHYVKQQLQQHFEDLTVEVLGLLTEGDKLLATPLSAIGGKGLFVKELERAILERRADIAVHSIKDLPADLLDDLILGAICVREDARDAFISTNFQSFKDLPRGARLGTSSLRRRSQLKNMRPDLEIENLRGNIGTRLQKLADGQFDAIVLASAGLHRLGLQNHIQHYFSIEEMLPAVGQGAIGVECLAHDTQTREWLNAINDPITRQCILAERSMNRYLEGGCQLPIGGYAEIKDNLIYLRGFVGSRDGSIALYAQASGDVNAADEIGKLVAATLLEQGAAKLIESARS
jgi:hydroxymethylbilane synthase